MSARAKKPAKKRITPGDLGDVALRIHAISSMCATMDSSQDVLDAEQIFFLLGRLLREIAMELGYEDGVEIAESVISKPKAVA